MKYFILSFVFAMLTHSIYALEVKGKVKDSNSNPVNGANIFLKGTNIGTITDSDGNYLLSNVETGSYEIVISHVGFKILNTPVNINGSQTLDFVLENDLLGLDEVFVTGTFIPRVKLESSMSLSTLSAKEISQKNSFGTADLLQSVPGVYTDPTAGEVFTKVYSRGLSISAEDDLGWFYTALQEDGLPVSAIQFASFSPDFFHRVDITTDQLQAVLGGSSSVTGMNAPGGIFNFISREGEQDFAVSLEANTGIQGDGNGYYRTDLNVGGSIGDRWRYNIGSFYRLDEGARNVDFNFNKGGQVKFNLVRDHSKGKVKFYGKYLNDRVNRWTGVAATNWDDPVAAYGQNFNTTAQMLPAFDGLIPDGEGGNRAFDPSNGIHTKDLALGIQVEQRLGKGWILNNNFKFSNKSANWQTSIANALVPIDNPLAYFISGDGFPIGQVIFRDVNNNQELASLDNFGTLGNPPSVTYLSAGTLPNDAILGISAWWKNDEVSEFMDQITLNKTFNNHQINLGVFYSRSQADLQTTGTFAYATYEPVPRLMRVTLENTGVPVVELSDAFGLSNYNGLFFEQGEATVTQLAPFIQDIWQISEKTILDIGLRYESIAHEGQKYRGESDQQPGGLDGDPTTGYDNNVLRAGDTVDPFDFSYSYLSYSLGANHKVNDNLALFGRFTSGNKAPELNYYMNNFANVPIEGKGNVQEILQAEGGIKLNGSSYSIMSTFFWSKLDNVSFSNFVLDSDENQLFYTPVQLNSTRALGLELETLWSPFSAFRIRLISTIQSQEASTFTVYNANGSIDIGDDTISDFSGNELPFNPNLIIDLTPEYNLGKFSLFLNWRYMGETQGNIANAFQLPAFSIFNTGISFALSEKMQLDLMVKNLFNSDGLMNFQGPNFFGGNGDAATSEYIAANPDSGFVVFPILPRRVNLKFRYTF